jgi:hypothetical protein
VDIVQLVDDCAKVLVFLPLSAVNLARDDQLTSSMTCPIRDLYGSHSSRKFMWPMELAQVISMVFLDLPMCPVEVKPEGTSSSGGRTEVKISSRCSVNGAAL